MMHKYEDIDRYFDTVRWSCWCRFCLSRWSIQAQITKQVNDSPVDINQRHSGVSD